MKNLFFLTLFVSLSALAHSGKIGDSLFVTDFSALTKISQFDSLTIDHPTQYGFELYGPKGTKAWLKTQGIDFYEIKETHNKEMADYPSYEEVVANLRSYVAKNPKIAMMFSIGKSSQGRDLWVVKISDNVKKDEVEPEFKYISSMHGDEITGRELTQFFIRDLIQGYGKDKEITDLIDNTEIYIMPSMNPDGSELRQRANARGYDLNRNFPDWKRGDVNTTQNRQVETQAVMKFQASRKFSLSANFHGGAVVVNYPWDNTYEKHPLDNLVKELSIRYADLNAPMRNSRSFPQGVTNGADWYKVFGGMQDWSYFWYDDLQVTVELSNRKWPSYRNIPGFYRDNKESMMTYLKAVHQGAGFKFSTSISGSVQIKDFNGGSDLGKFGFSGGEFYKVLPEGRYEFKINTDQGSTLMYVDVAKDKISTNGNFAEL